MITMFIKLRFNTNTKINSSLQRKKKTKTKNAETGCMIT